MLHRCSNEVCSDGEQCNVHIRWADFDTFLSDVGMPAGDMVLERIDKSKDYQPGNVRWIPREGKPPRFSLLRSILNLKHTANRLAEPMTWDDIATALGFNSASAVRYHMQKLLDKEPRCPMCLQKLSTKDVEH